MRARSGLQCLSLSCIALLAACTAILQPQFGIREGQLLPCPENRACVSSHAKLVVNYVEPLRYTSGRREAREDLIRAIYVFEGVRIVSSHRSYIRAEFPSKAIRTGDKSDYYFHPEMGVDDVEFYMPVGERVIHVRAVTRGGALDSGENRERLETLRKAFATYQSHD